MNLSDRRWADISASLDNFDRPRLHAALVSAMDRALSRNLTMNNKKDLTAALRKTLQARCGAWFSEQALWWMYAPNAFRFNGADPRGTQLTAHANEILERLARHHTYLTRLKAIFDASVLPPEPVLASLELQDNVTHIIELVVETTQCDDSWYHEAETALKWFLEHCGFDLNTGEREAILHCVGTTFSSWVVRPEQVRYVSDQITMNLVRRLFDERYPAP